MATKTMTDKFANMAVVSVTESAANTLTFKKLETAISTFDKVAWVINRVDYVLTQLAAAYFNGDSDSISFGLSVSNTFATTAIDEPTIIDYHSIQRLDYGAAATAMLMQNPHTADFSSLPSGGLLVAPVPLYMFIKGTGLASATFATARIWYSLMPLATEDYWELVESRRVLSS